MPSAHGGAGIEVILIKDNGKFIMTLINTKRLPVAVIIGATSKWQSDGRNTLLAHGHAVEDSTLPTSVRWGVGGCLLYTSPSPRDVEESRMPSSA